MDISISINPVVVVILIGVFIALRVWHPITAYAGRLKKKNTRSPF